MAKDEFQDMLDNSYLGEYDAPEFEDGNNDYYESDPDDYDGDYSSEDAELYIGITAQSKRQF